MSILSPDVASEVEYYPVRDEGTIQTVVAQVPLRSSPPRKKKKEHAMAKVPPRSSFPRRKNKQQTPQEAVDEFWSKFTTKAPGKATTIIPSNEYARRAAQRSNKAVGAATQASYDEAVAVCKAKVAKIVKECRRVNQKYRDPHFDLELDLKWGDRDTLESLCNTPDRPESIFHPQSVKRVADVFDVPQFYIDGPTASDVRQGRDGDCWLLAALCTLSNKPGLIERVCVARDEQVGVYGFVFHRDGEWISEIIDDKLFLTKPDFDESIFERLLWEDRERVDSEEQYRKAYQSGSGALYFAQCEQTNETWLPLLEKAYAKAHGDYQAIEGGFTGEGIEDLTGGVTTELYTTDILDKEYFWKEELMKVNDEFLFGCSTGMWGAVWGDRKGIVERHAYSVMRAVEIDGQRLVLLKNPWGKGEWKGPWSDGSKEWTAEWLTKLDHRFGNDGNFWISYRDLLRKYQAFDRTRLFGPDWKVTSIWTTVSVPWTLDYHDTYFAFSLAKTGPVVLVLSQLDSRYYRGLEGQYRFELNFRLHKKGQEDYVVRSITPYHRNRSVNVELELEAGEYIVLMKLNATRDLDILPIEEVIRKYARDRRDKLVSVGMYDLAHSKGETVEMEDEKQARKAVEKRIRDKEREALRKEIMQHRRDRHYMEVKAHKKEKEKRKKNMIKYSEKKAARAPGAAKDLDEKEKGIMALGSSGSLDEHSTLGNGDHMQTISPTTTVPELDSEVDGEPTPRSNHAEPEETTITGTGIKDKEAEDAPPLQPWRQQEEGPGWFSDDESTISSVSEISERELDIEFRDRIRVVAQSRRPPPPPPALPPPPPHGLPEEEEDEFESNPWNAVATVGLRVYYKVTEDKDEEVVKLHVVRPNAYVKKQKEEAISSEESDADGSGREHEEDAEVEAGKKSSKGLDIDDSAKDATLEGNREQRKSSILSLVPPPIGHPSR